MKLKLFIAFFIVLIVGYLMGIWLPISMLQFEVVSSQPDTIDVLNLSIRLFAAVSTVAAVIVALFKEDLRKIWVHSKIQVQLPDENFSENLYSDKIEDNSQNPLKAESYICLLEVLNNGNISATGVEIYIESLTFEGPNYPTSQTISVNDKSLSWSGITESKIPIPPEGKKKVKILEILAPEEQSDPEGTITNVPPKLRISDTIIDENFDNGEWEAKYAIYSTNSKPIRFTLLIKWNGKWENRASEMKSCLTISHKN